jgi:hypothetical protein
MSPYIVADGAARVDGADGAAEAVVLGAADVVADIAVLHRLVVGVVGDQGRQRALVAGRIGVDPDGSIGDIPYCPKTISYVPLLTRLVSRFRAS